MSLGVGHKKVLMMDHVSQEPVARTEKKDRYALVDEEGVNFRSVIDGSKHRFTPEISMPWYLLLHIRRYSSSLLGVNKRTDLPTLSTYRLKQVIPTVC